LPAADCASGGGDEGTDQQRPTRRNNGSVTRSSLRITGPIRRFSISHSLVVEAEGFDSLKAPE
jgi:hypothetical protein